MEPDSDISSRVGDALTDEQISAIRYAKHLGRLLAGYHPEVAEQYRSGSSHVQIGDKYFGDTIDSATVRQSAARFALEALLDEDERLRLCEEHRQQNSVNNGNQSLAGQKGFFSKQTQWSTEEIEYLRNLVNSGNFARKSPSGRIIPDWQQIADSLNQNFGNKRSKTACSRAYSPNNGEFQRYRCITFSAEEEQDLVQLVNDPQYFRVSSSGNKIPKWQDITDEINMVYGTNRDKGTCKAKYRSILKTEGAFEIKQKHTPWSDDEKRYLCELVGGGKYVWQDGGNKGSVMWGDIIKELNSRFRNDRLKKACTTIYYQLRDLGYN